VPVFFISNELLSVQPWYYLETIAIVFQLITSIYTLSIYNWD